MDGDNFESLPWWKTREVNAATIWFRDFFNGNERTNSDAIYDFAVARWDACGKAKQVIENKADAILKFMAILAAAMVTLARVAGIDHGVVLFLIPSMVLFGLSGICALAAMKTSQWPTPIGIKVALEECDNDIARQKTQLAASLHCAIVAATIELQQKAKILDYANACSLTGILALGFALFA